MEDLIDDLTKIPLSGEDMLDICSALGADRSRLGWLTYDELNNFVTTKDLFKEGQIHSVFILFTPPNTNIGHWVVLGNNMNGLFFFDPYGFTIEEDIKITMSGDRLLMLVMGQNIDVNRFRYQKLGTDMGTDINTCGRWAAIRAFMFWATNNKFQSIIEPVVKRGQVNDLDTLANLLTAFLSKSDDVVERFLMK